MMRKVYRMFVIPVGIYLFKSSQKNHLNKVQNLLRMTLVTLFSGVFTLFYKYINPISILNGDTKSYFMYYSRVVIILFSKVDKSLHFLPILLVRLGFFVFLCFSFSCFCFCIFTPWFEFNVLIDLINNMV